MSNKTQLQENNQTLEYVIEQLADKPTTEECMEAIDELSEQVTPLMLNGAKIASGSYTGTKKSGSTNRNSLTFPFTPKGVIITSGANGTLGPWIYGTRYGTTFTQAVSNTKLCVLTWEDNTLTWYSDDSDPSSQLNALDDYTWMIWF